MSAQAESSVTLLNEKENSTVCTYLSKVECQKLFISKKVYERVISDYDTVVKLSENSFFVNKNGKEGVIDSVGHIILPIAYDSIYIPNDNNHEKFIKIIKDNKYGLIDRRGSLVIPADYTNITKNRNGSYLLKSREKIGLVDKYGKFVLPAEYDSIRLHQQDSSEKPLGDFSRSSFTSIKDFNGLKIVAKSNKYGLVSAQDKLILPVRYDEIETFYNNVALVKKDGLYGVINIEGDVVIPPKYKEISDFHQGIAYAKLEDKWGFIDKAGKTILPFDYEEISIFPQDFGFYLIKKDSKWGVVDLAGAITIPIKYDHIAPKDDRFLTSYKIVGRSLKEGVISKNGKIVLPAIYDEIARFNEGIVDVRIGDDIFQMNEKGQRVY